MPKNWLMGIAALLISFSLTGCKLASHMYYSELKEYKAEMRLKSDFLVIKLDNPMGLLVAKINTVYKDDNLYLGAIRISSGRGGIREYKLQLPANTTPSDIKKQIYWVNPDGSVNLLYPEYLK